MADIFGQQPMAFGDAMSADHAVILFAGPNGWSEAGILTTQMMLNYSQPVMRVFDFGAVGLGIPAAQYFIIGHPVGNGTFGQIMGPRPINYCFYLAFGSACGVRNNNFLVAVGAGCNPSNLGNFAFWISNCLLTAFGFNVGAQDMLFSTNLPFMFIGLEVPATMEDCGLANQFSQNLTNAQSLTSFGASSNQQSQQSIGDNRTPTGPIFDRPLITQGDFVPVP